MPQYHRTVRDLVNDIDPQERLQLDGLTFRLNPSTWRVQGSEVKTTVQTADGAGRYDYGAKPPVYTFDAGTGLDGIKGTAGVQALQRRFMPAPHRADRQIVMRVPWDRGVHYVYVNDFEVSADASNPYWFVCHFELEEFPPHARRAALPLPGAVLPLPLPAGG